MAEELLLVQKVKHGDHKAFHELYNRNVTNLYRFMSQFTGDKDQLEDWVQRAFIKSYENIHKFDGISLYATWLFKIALNEMRMDYRKAGRIFQSSFNEEEHAAFDEEKFEWDHVMKTWLNEIDEVKRAVFLLYEVEGYSHAEIAEMLNIKESTSRTILTRTKQWLKQKWNEEYINDKQR